MPDRLVASGLGVSRRSIVQGIVNPNGGSMLQIDLQFVRAAIKINVIIA
jgi:hypothetical protein